MTRWSWTCAIKWEAEEQTYYNFPASWLRSSVVSVFISLVVDTWATGSLDINLTFSGDKPITVASNQPTHGTPNPS